MKYLISVILLFTFLFAGCIPTIEISKDASEKVFEHKVTLNKEQLKTKLLQYVNEHYNSSKSVIQTNEDGFLTGNGIFDLHEYAPLGGITLFGEITFLVKYSDNLYKLKFIIKDIYSVSGGAKTELSPSYWGYYNKNIINTMNDEDSTLYNYLMNNNQNF